MVFSLKFSGLFWSSWKKIIYFFFVWLVGCGKPSTFLLRNIKNTFGYWLRESVGKYPIQKIKPFSNRTSSQNITSRCTKKPEQFSLYPICWIWKSMREFQSHTHTLFRRTRENPNRFDSQRAFTFFSKRKNSSETSLRVVIFFTFSIPFVHCR